MPPLILLLSEFSHQDMEKAGSGSKPAGNLASLGFKLPFRSMIIFHR